MLLFFNVFKWGIGPQNQTAEELKWGTDTQNNHTFLLCGLLTALASETFQVKHTWDLYETTGTNVSSPWLSSNSEGHASGVVRAADTAGCPTMMHRTLRGSVWKTSHTTLKRFLTQGQVTERPSWNLGIRSTNL